ERLERLRELRALNREREDELILLLVFSVVDRLDSSLRLIEVPSGQAHAWPEPDLADFELRLEWVFRVVELNLHFVRIERELRKIDVRVELRVDAPFLRERRARDLV